ncbi:MAG TPA: hypothetical protein VH677_00090 [Nitrososphaera sp.]|jgi:hypothetical protein
MSDFISDVGKKIKEAAGGIDNLTQFRKKTKLQANYVENDKFTDSNLHEGYFCYNCIYWMNAQGGRCVLVDADGPDADGKVSGVIAPHGCCMAYEPNYDKLHDTREPGASMAQDTEKNREKVTTADVV